MPTSTAPADQLLLLRVDRDHRLAARLTRRLQPVAQAVQQPAHSRSAPPPARATLARPAAARSGRRRERIHQRFERGLDAGLILLDAGPSAARASDAVRRRLDRGQSPGAPCESSPEPHRWPTKPPRRRRSRWRATRPPPTGGDCARPTRARPRHTSQPGSLPVRCLASYLQYDQQPSRWQTSFAQCPKQDRPHVTTSPFHLVQYRRQLALSPGKFSRQYVGEVVGSLYRHHANSSRPRGIVTGIRDEALTPEPIDLRKVWSCQMSRDTV